MANIMSLKSLRNKTSRNGFDLSTKRNFTAKVGELLPVGHWAVLPGDNFNINLKSFTRTQPINTAAFARIREYYDFFFVPYNMLWNKANTVLTQMYDNSQHSVNYYPSSNELLDGSVPYVTCKGLADYIYNMFSGYDNYFGYNRGVLTVKLLQYLGYGDFSYYMGNYWSQGDPTTTMKNNLQLNLFPLLAYQKIYADYFRDSQWERVSPSRFNVDYITGFSGSTHVDLSQMLDGAHALNSYYNYLDLNYCNWQKDLFHGVVPRQQYGDVSTVVSDVVDNPSVSEAKITEFSILALRQAEFLQKWKEITLSANKDYKEQIDKHWNVSTGDAFSEMCTYLGGISSSLDINEVVNSNITESFAADIAGKGTGVSNGSIRFNNPTNQYGVIMCIYHALPLIDYTTSLVDPMLTKVNVEDFAIPEFDRVGMQGVPSAIFSNPVGTLSELEVPDILGYAPRYIEYKTGIDYSVGAFKKGLKNWVISFDDSSFANQLGSKGSAETPTPAPSGAPQANYTMFKVNPNSVDPLFGVKANAEVDTDQFLCSTFFDIKAVRNLDTDGLPY